MTMAFTPLGEAIAKRDGSFGHIVKPLQACAPELDETILKILVMERPHLAADAVVDTLVADATRLRGALSVLFGRGDIETAHAIISRKNISLDSCLENEVRGSLDAAIGIWKELCDKEYADSVGVCAAPEQAKSLFEHYVRSQGTKIELAEVMIPEHFNGKFMLLESSVGLLLRTGGPQHRDIMKATRRELACSGRPKAGQDVEQKGGGWVTQMGEFLVLSGASGEFRAPDYRIVKNVVSQAYPERTVMTPDNNSN